MNVIFINKHFAQPFFMIYHTRYLSSIYLQRRTLDTGNMAQWWSTCLKCIWPEVQSSVHTAGRHFEEMFSQMPILCLYICRHTYSNFTHWHYSTLKKWQWSFFNITIINLNTCIHTKSRMAHRTVIHLHFSFYFYCVMESQENEG